MVNEFQDSLRDPRYVKSQRNNASVYLLRSFIPIPFEILLCAGHGVGIKDVNRTTLRGGRADVPTNVAIKHNHCDGDGMFVEVVEHWHLPG